jgi:hypothetical protein
MNMLSQDEYLNDRLDRQIKWYSKKATVNKRLNNWSRILMIVMGTAITIVTQVDIETNIKSIVLTLIGSSVALLAGLSGILKFQEKWMTYRSTAEALRQENFLFKAKAGPYDNTDAFKILVTKVESIISNENSSWRDLVSNP